MIAHMGSATARARFEKPEELNAPLFRLLLEQLEAPRRWVIFDLGAPSTPMLDLLSQHRCRIEIADLSGNGAIEKLRAETEDPRLLEAAADVLPAPGKEPIDVVLAWDMLNYLEPAAVSAVMRTLAERSHPGTLAHGLIVYLEQSMPARPGRWVPTPDRHLHDRSNPAGEIPAPRYSPEDLGRLMAPFAIERGMLLGNGMQEFLFRLQ